MSALSDAIHSNKAILDSLIRSLEDTKFGFFVSDGLAENSARVRTLALAIIANGHSLLGKVDHFLGLVEELRKTQDRMEEVRLVEAQQKQVTRFGRQTVVNTPPRTASADFTFIDDKIASEKQGILAAVDHYNTLISQFLADCGYKWGETSRPKHVQWAEAPQSSRARSNSPVNALDQYQEQLNAIRNEVSEMSLKISEHFLEAVTRDIDNLKYTKKHCSDLHAWAISHLAISHIITFYSVNIQHAPVDEQTAIQADFDKMFGQYRTLLGAEIELVAQDPLTLPRSSEKEKAEFAAAVEKSTQDYNKHTSAILSIQKDFQALHERAANAVVCGKAKQAKGPGEG